MKHTDILGKKIRYRSDSETLDFLCSIRMTGNTNERSQQYFIRKVIRTLRRSSTPDHRHTKEIALGGN